MMRDVSSCNTYDYGDAEYWNSRYTQEDESLFDWYRRYSALRPFIRNFITYTSSPVLVVGCGNADKQMDVRDMSFFPDESFDGIIDKGCMSVCVFFMHIYQITPVSRVLMSSAMLVENIFVAVTTFWHLRSVNPCDIGTLDSLMYGSDAPISASQMLGEVSRLLKPGGVYIMITYGEPKVRMPLLNRAAYDWNTTLYIQRKYVHLSENEIHL